MLREMELIRGAIFRPYYSLNRFKNCRNHQRKDMFKHLNSIGHETDEYQTKYLCNKIESNFDEKIL